MLVDVRYILVAIILVVALWLIYRRPHLAVPTTVALAAATLAYAVLFPGLLS